MMPIQYWEQRAAQYATRGNGLAAVCSYGMPAFYNWRIDLCQRLALAPWMQVHAGVDALDIGCGVGRWSLALAAQGARVTGVDLSSTMLREAARRAKAAGLQQQCEFMAGDVATLDLQRTYSLVLVVTVLQHVLNASRLDDAIERLASHVRPGGRLVILEAAPNRHSARCDTRIFTARTQDDYLRLFHRHGLDSTTVTGVDPMPLPIKFLPYYRELPKPLAVAGLAAATAVSLPVDAVLGRWWVHPSWHKVFVLTPRPGGGRA